MIDLIEDSYLPDYAMRPCHRLDNVDWALSLIWPMIPMLSLGLMNSELLHWFLLPIYLCGVLVGLDAWRWVRGKMDPFDPKGFIGLIGVNFFVIAPLLVVHHGVDNVEQYAVRDWRPYLGYVALLSAVGLLGYRWTERWGFKKPTRAARTYWVWVPGRASVVLPTALLIATACYGYYLVRMGGIGGVMLESRQGEIVQDAAGAGIFLVVGQSVPILLMIAMTFLKSRIERKSSAFTVNLILIILLLLQLFFGSLRGSRSSTVWGMLWMLGIIHFFWRPLRSKYLILAAVPLIAFLYFYGFYKSMGSDMFAAMRQGAGQAALQAKTGRTIGGMFVGDLSRADVQAAQINVLLTQPWEYDFRWGSTYATSVVPLIPRALWPNKPSDTGKVIAGTEMLNGPNSYVSPWAIVATGRRSSRIYGLAGEAMLNFGLLGVIPAFLVWGYIVGRIRSRLHAFRIGDVRLLTAPFLVTIAFLLLVHDMSNIVAVTLFKWVIPAAVVFIMSQRWAAAWLQEESFEEDYDQCEALPCG